MVLRWVWELLKVNSIMLVWTWRKYYRSRTTVINAIREELRGPGQLFGYRTMWQVLRQKYHLKVKRDNVMNLLRELNPRGCERRARRRSIRRTYHSLGANYMWHADGYDELKPFWLAISGCIDGFSRKVLWLKCGPTNNNLQLSRTIFFLKIIY